MKAIVVGAGIGGLTTALCLRARGWDVVVLERAEALRDVGAGLQIPPNAMRVFAKLGLADALDAVGARPHALEAVDASGRALFAIPLANAPWGAPYLHIHRADYLRVLSDALEARAPGSLRLGVEVNALDGDGSHVLAAGQEADMLVAADGLRSTLRRLVFDPAPPRWTGQVAWRATVSADLLDDPPPATARVWMGAGRHCVTYRLRGGDLVNFVGVVERDDWREEGWSHEGDRADALDSFAGFHPEVMNILKIAPVLYRWALFDRPPLQRWTRGRVALLGDAAHPMLPFMAQGAAMAVEDAWALADEVTSRGVEPGLKAYQLRRHARATRVQAASRRNAKLFHLSGLEKMLAHAALRTAQWAAPSLIRRRFDWIYGYDPTA